METVDWCYQNIRYYYTTTMRIVINHTISGLKHDLFMRNTLFLHVKDKK